ncbi:DUF4148 domain-containing protein [Burkholderia sp. PU8-34]
MKSLIATFAAAAVLAVPAASFAQQNAPVTRAQVKAELAQLQQAGYKLGSDRTTYPEGILAAEARVHPQQNVAAADTSGFGAQSAAQQESGAPAAAVAGSRWPNGVKRIADDAPVYKGR